MGSENFLNNRARFGGHYLGMKMMMEMIYFSDTRKRFYVGQTVYTPQGGGVIEEIRKNCAYPLFVRFADGAVNAFESSEVIDGISSTA